MSAVIEKIAEKIKAASPKGIAPVQTTGILVATPTLGAVSMLWHDAASRLVWPMNVHRASVPMVDNEGGQIAEMRNQCVLYAMALEQAHPITVDSIMWLDDDVLCHPMAMCQLRQHDRDIAAGVYFCKSEIPEPLIFAGPSSGTMKFRPNEVFEAWGWPMGLSLIKLDVYRRMQDELDLGTDRRGFPAWYQQPGFGFQKETGSLITGGTEDFKFFDSASKIGIRPLVDCGKIAFGWHYDLASKTGYPQKQWEQRVKHQPITWDTKEGVILWD
jgi:hypothetical protein